MRLLLIFFMVVRIVLTPSFSTPPHHKTVDVLIVGGGASGTMAGIQAARMGVKTGFRSFNFPLPSSLPNLLS